MTEKEEKAIAAFLRENLKQGTEAITIVMTRDIIKSMYQTARIAVVVTEMMKEMKEEEYI